MQFGAEYDIFDLFRILINEWIPTTKELSSQGDTTYDNISSLCFRCANSDSGYHEVVVLTSNVYLGPI